jgi:hypothetical protein
MDGHEGCLSPRNPAAAGSLRINKYSSPRLAAAPLSTGTNLQQLAPPTAPQIVLPMSEAKPSPSSPTNELDLRANPSTREDRDLMELIGNIKVQCKGSMTILPPWEVCCPQQALSKQHFPRPQAPNTTPECYVCCLDATRTSTQSLRVQSHI